MSRAERVRKASRERARPAEGRAAAATATAARGRARARAHGETQAEAPRGARPVSCTLSAHARWGKGVGGRVPAEREVCSAQAQCAARL